MSHTTSPGTTIFRAANGYKVTITPPDSLGHRRVQVGSGEDVSLMRVSPESWSALLDFFFATRPLPAETRDWYLAVEEELYDILTDAQTLTRKWWRIPGFVRDLAKYGQSLQACWSKDRAHHLQALKAAVAGGLK